MTELVNISNDPFDVETILGGKRENLEEFLAAHDLGGIELLLCSPLDEAMFPRHWIRGVHLRFWPVWLDFWRGNKKALAETVGDEEAVEKTFGAANCEKWLEIWRENLRQARESGARYVVFHVAHTPLSEIAMRPFTAITDDEVVEATIELIGEIVKELSEDCFLLYENLWWPGLTFRRVDLVQRLLDGTPHKNTGFMLDTGHLMSTNLDLTDEADSADYVVRTFRNLGEFGKYVHGLHLHQSQSGAYVRRMMEEHARGRRFVSFMEKYEYISNVDYHAPFQTEAVRRIVDAVEPEYLVHEFLQRSLPDWNEKVYLQRQALGLESLRE